MFQKDFLVREIENFSRFAIRMLRKEKVKHEIEEEQVQSIEDDYLLKCGYSGEKYLRV